MSFAIEINHLLFGWRKQAAPLLDIPSWQVEAGRRVFLHGPSGTGKSTLLNLLSGLLTARQGQVEVIGQDLGRLGVRARDRFRARHIGVIFQQFNLLPYLSVADNIVLARHFQQRSERGFAPAVAELAERLGLPRSLLERPAGELSVGQQQRVAAARALIMAPEVILADEPTSALDAPRRDEFIELLMECATAVGSTVIFASHDRELARHFDEVVDLLAINQVAAGAAAGGVAHAV